jgi:hypothetical protein
MICMMIAAMIEHNNLSRNNEATTYNPDESLSQNTLGAIGEMALAKHLNVFWCGNVGDLEAIDVNGSYNVRCRSQHWHDLPVKQQDKEEFALVLATREVKSLIVRLHGWIYPAEGKRRDLWKELKPGQGNFLVPQTMLHPMEELP